MAKPSDRRPESAITDDVAEFERQLWEFAKRPNPPKVPEATLRPGAFLHRMYRTWHSLGRGAGGLASHSFRALKEELLKRDPPVRNLQPKLYGATALAQTDAANLIDVMLKTWRVSQTKTGSWHATQLRPPPNWDAKPAAAGPGSIDALAENLLATLFQNEDTLLLEEAVGVPPEVFFEERGKSCAALILPTKPETLVHLPPAAAYGGLSALVFQFFKAALANENQGAPIPLLIWIYRLPSIRDNAEFHQAFYALAVHSAALTNWYLRLSRQPASKQAQARRLWSIVSQHCAFVVHGLPWNADAYDDEKRASCINEELADLDIGFFLPSALPIKFQHHRHVNVDLHYSLAVSVNRPGPNGDGPDGRLSYWLFPEKPQRALDETAETTGLPVFDAESSPGADYDLAYSTIYGSVAFRLGLELGASAQAAHAAMTQRSFKVLRIAELQTALLTHDALLDLGKPRNPAFL